MAITINDIADACGVSRGTVDRALNDKPRISPKTREKILGVAKELGYQPDIVARSLVKGKTRTIGVVVFDIRNRYFALLLNSIEKEAKANNYSVIIMLQEKDVDLELKVLNELVGRRVDGILLCPVNKGEQFCSLIEKLAMPVITIGNFLNDRIHYIGIDEKKAAIEGTKLIVSKGYEKIVFVCPYMEDGITENIHVHQQRYDGFMEVAEVTNGVEFITIEQQNELHKIKDLINAGKRTALFCSGDMLALDVIKDLKLEGLKAPTNYGIMGFDGLDILDYISPSLTSIYNPVEEIGRQAFVALWQLIQEEEIPARTQLPYHLIKGETL